MYNPSAFAVSDPVEIAALLAACPFAHLVGAGPDGSLHAAAAPFLFDPELRTIRLHLARANPFAAEVDGRPVLLIAPGADGYVSPRWYPSKAEHGKVVPTWNYEAVHVHGTARRVEDPAWLRHVVHDLTERHESTLGAPQWAIADAPESFVATMLAGIVGLEIAVRTVEAKRKLSQNRAAVDVEGVRQGLAGSDRPSDRRLGERMAEPG